MVLVVTYHIFICVYAIQFTWSSESFSCWREVLHQQGSESGLLSHVAYNVYNVMASSPMLLPGATVHAAREGDLISNLMSRSSNHLIYGFSFRVSVRGRVIYVQAALEKTSTSGRARCTFVGMCWCTDFLALLSGFAVHELAARYVFPSFLSSKR